MIDFYELTDIVMKLTALPFFPTDDQGRLAIVEEIGEMVHSLKEARWLVNRTLKLYPKWSSVVELRAVLCAKVMPRDGIEAVSGSFPDGIIPPERPERLQIAAPPPALQPGEPASADPAFAELAAKIARAKSLRLPDVHVDTEVKPGETEDRALARSVKEWHEKHAPKSTAKVASDEEIDAIKREQAGRAQHEETREVLASLARQGA